MTIGDTVQIKRTPPQRTVPEEWAARSKYLPNQGTVEHISPHGWVLVRLHSRRTGKAIYCECFDAQLLCVVRR